jgi:hypothetical protein
MQVAFSHRMSPFPRESLVPALQLAARAPSAHNTQPWIVRTRGDRLFVLADRARWLAHGDPTKRDLRLALGGFVEAVHIGLGSVGLAAEQEAPTAAGEAGRDEIVAVLRAAGSGKPDRARESLLRRRQSSRLPYSPRPLEPALAEALSAAARSAGLDLHLIDRDSAERADVDGWFYASARESWLDQRALHELAAWIRVDPEGLRRPDDGLSTHCLGLGPGATAVLLTLLRPNLWRAAHALYAAPTLAAQLARQETTQVQQTPFIGVLIAPHPQHDAGAGVLRVWLEAVRLGLAMAPISVLLDRRGWELGRRLGVAPGQLLLAFRLGRSIPPPLSHRRPVDRFASLGGAVAPGIAVA